MEAELKLRLKDAHSHKQLTSLLSQFHIKTLHQDNLYLDTPTSSLSSQRAVLLLRKHARFILCLKSNATLVNGVSRVEGDWEELDPEIAKECIKDPSKLLGIESRVVKRVREEFGVGSEAGLVCLGGFENLREVYEWNGLMLEVDETKYDFGTNYEVECESSDPEGVKKLLEGFLNENGIEFEYSRMAKFAVFRAGKLPESDRKHGSTNRGVSPLNYGNNDHGNDADDMVLVEDEQAHELFCSTDPMS